MLSVGVDRLKGCHVFAIGRSWAAETLNSINECLLLENIEADVQVKGKSDQICLVDHHLTNVPFFPLAGL